ncbi:hypothetical protein AAVH_41817, partial [Aphelenchoides avenae]
HHLEYAVYVDSYAININSINTVHYQRVFEDSIDVAVDIVSSDNNHSCSSDVRRQGPKLHEYRLVREC